jgi:hypothetical protein
MRIGVTGHQRLAHASAWDWVRSELTALLRRGAGPLVGISSLAAGTDQIFADLVLRHGGALEVVIPFPGYAEKFLRQSDQREYERLLRAASLVETLRRDGSDEEAYMEAGKRVVNASDLLVAVWDGRPAAGLGGTADVVEYAARRKKKIIHLNPIARTVLSIQGDSSSPPV